MKQYNMSPLTLMIVVCVSQFKWLEIKWLNNHYLLHICFALLCCRFLSPIFPFFFSPFLIASTKLISKKKLIFFWIFDIYNLNLSHITIWIWFWTHCISCLVLFFSAARLFVRIIYVCIYFGHNISFNSQFNSICSNTQSFMYPSLYCIRVRTVCCACLCVLILYDWNALWAIFFLFFGDGWPRDNPFWESKRRDPNKQTQTLAHTWEVRAQKQTVDQCQFWYS